MAFKSKTRPYITILGPVILLVMITATWLIFSSDGWGSVQKSVIVQDENTLPVDLIEIADAQYASLDSLAPGSREAQEQQREAVRQLGLPLEVKTRKTGIVFRLVPSGTFIMGSPSSEQGRHDDEIQHHVVLTKAFCCGKFEVTQGQWMQVMGKNPSAFIIGEKVWPADPNHPVGGVSKRECQTFLDKLCELEGIGEGAYRLLTEAEWEYACRAGTQTAFCYGNDLDSSMANFDEYASEQNERMRLVLRSAVRTVVVGRFRPNAWGLHEMHGNVSEWCADEYGPYPSESVTDQLGKGGKVYSSVSRGGSWGGSDIMCRSAERFARSNSGIKYDGLRIARSIPACIENVFMEMIRIEPGSFQMGSDSSTDEEPVHTVRIRRPFWIGKYEVTQLQYEAITGTNPSDSKRADLPVENVSWNDAVLFCRILTEKERRAGRLPAGYVYRLPTEAEWEYAARGGAKSQEFTYAGSSNLDEVAWHKSNSGDKIQPVGKKKPNELGLYDMSGNVEEWCYDWYEEHYYTNSRSSDPTGPPSGDERVIRGGSHISDDPWSFRMSNRTSCKPGNWILGPGFRVVESCPLD